MFAPLKQREDGTVVFALPIGSGHIPMIALADIGFFARYAFDNRAATSGQELRVASDMVDSEYLRTTFEEVTGRKAEVIPQTIDEWMNNFEGVDRPLTTQSVVGDASVTWRENFAAWWAVWRDDIVKRDMKWVRRVHPEGYTLEKWMREKRYTGNLPAGNGTLLKNAEKGKGLRTRWEVVNAL